MNAAAERQARLVCLDLRRGFATLAMLADVIPLLAHLGACCILIDSLVHNPAFGLLDALFLQVTGTLLGLGIDAGRRHLTSRLIRC